MNKLFQKCSKKEITDCQECANYRNCVTKKKQIRKKKRMKRRLKKCFVVLIGAIFLFLLLIPFIFNSNEDDDQTNQTTTDKPQITSTFDCGDNSLINTNDSITSSTTSIQTEEIKKEPEVPIISAYGPSEDYYYNFSEEDKLYMAKVVYAEARGEIYEGQVAVAAVIINRYYSDVRYFDRTSIKSIVTQKNQFAKIDSVTDEKLAKCPNCMDAVEDACKGWDPTRAVFENGALYFFSPAGVSGYQAKIREGIEYIQIGNHRFHVDFND